MSLLQKTSPCKPSRPPAGALAQGVPVSPRATGRLPHAGRLAVRPAGRVQAAGRLTRRSCLGLGDRQQASISRLRRSHAGREAARAGPREHCRSERRF